MQFGWWDIDIGGLTLTNRYTGQMLAYRGEVPEDERLGIVSTPSLRWMRLEYSDRDLCYPLFVQRRAVPDQHGDRKPIWRVDHLRSARAWAREGRSGSVLPPYGTWRRVDECVQDALSCWPKSRQTGAMPSAIALEGGWHNGAWTRNLYRSRRALSEVTLECQCDPVMRPWLLPLDLPVPSPWRLVEASGGGKGGSLLSLASELLKHGFFKRRTKKIDCAHLARDDGSARLIPIAVRPDRDDSQTLDWKDFRVRLLYLDEAHVWDAIEARNCYAVGADDDPVVWEIREDLLKASIGVPDPSTAQSLLLRRETELSRHISQKSRRKIITWERAGDDLRRELGKSLSEALLAWVTRSLWLTKAGAGGLHEIKMPTAMLVNSFGHQLAGVSAFDATTRQLTATSLLPNASGHPHPLRYMFEENDSVLRVSQRTEHLGWWDYDPETTAVANRHSQQRLSFAGRFTSHRDIAACEPGEPQWFRFDYSDPEVRFPILARRGTRGLDGPLSDRWEVDYNRSRLLWAQETGQAIEHPSYGVWRRVHDCTLDALFCWPELDATGEPAGVVTFAGGWANGAWRPLLHIWAECGDISRRNTWADRRYPVHYGGDERPILEPLDASAPPAWQFFDAPVAERGASITGLVIRPASQRLTLSAKSSLKGFEQKVPFVRRADGGAVFFPHGVRSLLMSGESYSAWPELLYADETALLLLSNRWGEGDFRLGIHAVGLRNPSEDEGLWRLVEEDRTGCIWHYPSLRLHRRLQPSLADAWLAWRGCDKRMLDDPDKVQQLNDCTWMKEKHETSGFSLERPRQVRLSGHYLAGLFFPSMTQTLKLPDAPPDPVEVLKGRMADAQLQAATDRLILAARQTPPKRL